MDVANQHTRWIRLALAEGVGVRTKRRVVQALGVEATCHASTVELAPHIGKARAQSLRQGLDQVHVPSVLSRCTTLGHRIVTPCSGQDLDWLFDISIDAPLALFTQGSLPSKNALRVAIVGTRHASSYGLDMAASIADELARLGICIVSGFALGIDGSAHEGALAHMSSRANEPVAAPPRCASLAVLGCGLDIAYPRAHSSLRHSMNQHGGFISEYPPGTTPTRWHFPQRNRLVASWSHAVVVVEAPKKSGALITAHLALDAGREVLVVPGSVRHPGHEGSHELLRQGGARVCTGVNDILIALGRDPSATAHHQGDALPVEPEDAERHGVLWRALDDSVAATVDVLCTRSSMPAHTLRAALTKWELEGWVKRVPGIGYLRSRP